MLDSFQLLATLFVENAANLAEYRNGRRTSVIPPDFLSDHSIRRRESRPNRTSIVIE